MLYTLFFFFFFNDTATTEIYTLSLHDALPIYGAACARVKRTRTFALVNPVLALGLLAVAGLLAARLPRPSSRRPPSLDLAITAGVPLILLGLVLGPGIELLARPLLRALDPLTAGAIGWIGAVLGARFEWRYARRIPRGAWLLAAAGAGAAFLAVALGAWLLTRLVPGLAAGWAPRLPAVLAIAAVAAASGPAAVTAAAQAAGVERHLTRALGCAATLETACAALAMGAPLALRHPLSWAVFAVGGGALGGGACASAARLIAANEDVTPAVVGSVLFGAGIGYATDVSPFMVCALAGLVAVNASPRRRDVRAALRASQRPIYTLVLIVSGALLALPTLWILAAVLLLQALRIGARWLSGRYARVALTPRDLPPHVGLGTVAQGGAALALALNYFLMYGGRAESTDGVAPGGGDGGGARGHRAAPGRGPRVDAGHARLPRRIGAGEPAPAAGRPRRPATGLPLRLPVRQHRGRHLAREEVRPRRAALSRLARGPGDLRPRADRPAALVRARVSLAPGRRRRGPQFLRAAAAGAHVEHGRPGPQLLGEPLRDPPGRGLRERGEGADSPGSHPQRHASRHHHFADLVQRADQSPAVPRDGAPDGERELALGVPADSREYPVGPSRRRRRAPHGGGVRVRDGDAGRGGRGGAAPRPGGRQGVTARQADAPPGAARRRSRRSGADGADGRGALRAARARARLLAGLPGAATLARPLRRVASPPGSAARAWGRPCRATPSSPGRRRTASASSLPACSAPPPGGGPRAPRSPSPIRRPSRRPGPLRAPRRRCAAPPLAPPLRRTRAWPPAG